MAYSDEEEVGEPGDEHLTSKALARLWRTELKDENGHSKPLKRKGFLLVFSGVRTLVHYALTSGFNHFTNCPDADKR
jgi:hypothetical protein